MRRLILCGLWSALILGAMRTDAAVLLNLGGPFKAQAEPREFLFEVPAAVKAALLEVSVTVSEGKATIRVKDPGGKEIFSSSGAGTMALGGQALKTTEPGMYRLELINEGGSANWAVRIITGADRAFLEQNLASGIGMLLVAIFAVLAWRSGAQARWRWFGAGAAIWIVGVALKLAWAIILNAPILRSLKAALPQGAYLAVGSIYIGLLTGVFEIGITLVAALIWKQMARDAARGVAVGVGAGAFEALLLGLAPVAAAAIALSDPSSDAAAAMGGAAAVASATPLFWMVGTVERIIAILCHTSSRTLVLYGVARGRWWPFVAGFLLMTGVDTVAGYAILSGIMGQVNTWWIELAVAPFAVASIPIIVWCVRHWPAVKANDQLPGTNDQ